MRSVGTFKDSLLEFMLKTDSFSALYVRGSIRSLCINVIAKYLVISKKRLLKSICSFFNLSGKICLCRNIQVSEYVH